MEILTIGIAGGTGSGMTTITRRILSEFGRDVAVLHHDSYYKAHDNMPFEERCRLNYDHPDAFDNELFLRHLRALRRGERAESPVHDYSIHNRTKETRTIRPARVLLVEGILIFADRRLCEEMDIKLFVDADADERILRRITRDMRDRGRSLESITNQYLSTVKPMHERFVEPSKRRADLIIPRGGRNTVALEMVLSRIRGFLAASAPGQKA